jgi:NTE family protein
MAEAGDTTTAITSFLAQVDDSPGLFQGVAPSTLKMLEEALVEVRLPAGATIFSQGDRGDALYLVRAGLVDVAAMGTAGRTRLVMGGPGETLGELSLITGKPRFATAVAETPVTLLRLDHASFLELLASDSRLAANVAHLLSERLTAADRALMQLPSGQIVALRATRANVAASAGARLAKTCERMLGEAPVVIAVGSPSDWGRSGLPKASRTRARNEVAGSASRAVRDQSLVLVLCHGPIEPSVLRVAHRVVVVGDEPAEGEEEPHRPVHALPAEPSADALNALARTICGRRVGLALGSGGTRGFAHAGVLSVLQEEGIPVDIVSGASAGSIAGALYLSGVDPRRMADLRMIARKTVGTGFPPKIPIPPRAILTGRRIRGFVANCVGRDTRIEDLPIPFIVATTDLETRDPVHLETGNLATAVTASSSVNGFFPSVLVDGRQLVDGGASDPVPVGILRERGADIIIAVNVMAIGKGATGLYSPRFRIPFLDTMIIGLETVMTQISVHSCNMADVVVQPYNANAPAWDLIRNVPYRRAGEMAMREAIPEVRRLIGA